MAYTWTDEPLIADETEVKAVHIEELREAAADLDSRIAEEPALREAADAAEEEARIAADNAETQARENADTIESEARVAADNAETQARENADNAEAQTRSTADSTEMQARIAGDNSEAQARQSEIDAEAQARIAADTSETQARIAADNSETQARILGDEAKALYWVAGTAQNGQRVNCSFATAPTVILSPSNMQTTIAGYTSVVLDTVCEASNIDTTGFTVNAYTSLLNGTTNTYYILNNAYTPRDQTITTAGNITSFTYDWSYSTDSGSAVEFYVYYAVHGTGNWIEVQHCNAPQNYNRGGVIVVSDSGSNSVSSLSPAAYDIRLNCVQYSSYYDPSDSEDSYTGYTDDLNDISIGNIICQGGGQIPSIGAVTFLAIEGPSALPYTVS